MKLTGVALTVLLFAALAAAQPMPPFTCPGNTVQNRTFANGINVIGNGSIPPSSG